MFLHQRFTLDCFFRNNICKFDRVLRARYFENHSKGFPKLSFKNYLQKIKYDRLQSYPPPNKIVLLVTVLADNFIVSVVE